MSSPHFCNSATNAIMSGEGWNSGSGRLGKRPVNPIFPSSRGSRTMVAVVTPLEVTHGDSSAGGGGAAGGPTGVLAAAS
jgi:hypothetical protein